MIANDRFSSRPLYYAQLSDGGIAFGSQVHTVLQAPDIPRDLDERSVRELFQYQRVHGTRTLNRAISMLPPATFLRVSDGRIALECWFQMDYRPERRTVTDWAEALADSFHRSARRCLRGTNRVGLLLSGGLDSRMVVAAVDDQITCFHFNDSQNREYETARRIAAVRDFEFTYLPRTVDHYANLFEHGVDIGDGQYAFFHSHALGLLPQDSVDVILHGFAPELFFRGTNLPRAPRTVLGRTIYLEDLEVLATVNEANVAREIRSNLKYSLHHTQPHQFFRESWAKNFESLMLVSAQELVDDARLHSDDPYDWFIWADTRFHCKYPSFLFEMALRHFHTERSVVFHNDILDLHLRMPIRARADSRIWNRAVRRLNRHVAAVPNANTERSLFPGPLGLTIDLTIEAATRIGRRFGIQPRPRGPELKPGMPWWHTEGSWPSFRELIVHEERLRKLIEATIVDPEAIDPDIFDIARIKSAFADHLTGRQNHTDFLLLLATFGGWHRKYGPPGKSLAAR